VSHPAAKWLTASAWIRPMTGDETGGSQPQVFDTEDGYYMVKVSNNPQGPRVLLNELLGGLCMDWLGVVHPDPAIIDIPEAVITSSPQARFQGSGAPLAHGLAFGSKYWQSDPQATVDVSLLANRENVAATLAFDTWVPNGDGRQYRVRRRADDPTRYDYIPVDQGHSFGPTWTAETLGAVSVVQVPDAVTPLTVDDFAAVIARLREFDLEHAEAIVREVPDEWWTQVEKIAAREHLFSRAPAAAEALQQKYPTPIEPEVTP